MRSFLRAQSVILLDKLGFDDGTRRGEIRPVPGEIGLVGAGEITAWRHSEITAGAAVGGAMCVSR